CRRASGSRRIRRHCGASGGGGWRSTRSSGVAFWAWGPATPTRCGAGSRAGTARVRSPGGVGGGLRRGPRRGPRRPRRGAGPRRGTDVAALSRGTVLVPGGVGALGLRVARGLWERRQVGHLTLMARRPPDEARSAAIDALRAAGARVTVCLGDVGDPAALA